MNKRQEVLELLERSRDGLFACDVKSIIIEAIELLESEPEPISLKVDEMPNRPVGAVEYAQAQDGEIDRLTVKIETQKNQIQRLQQYDDSSTKVIGEMDDEIKKLKEELKKAYERMDTIEQNLNG